MNPSEETNWSRRAVRSGRWVVAGPAFETVEEILPDSAQEVPRPLVRQLLTLATLLHLLVGACSLFLGATAKPLPFSSAETACALGAAYCIFASATTLALGRFGLFSLPGAFLGVSGLYLVGLLIAFPLLGDEAFGTWFLVDMEAVLQGVPLVMLAFACCYLGSACAVTRGIRSGHETSAIEPSNVGVTYVRLIGAALFATAMLVVVSATLGGGGLRYAMDGGYSYLSEMQYQEGGTPILWASLNWFLPWGVLILAATARKFKDLAWLAVVVIPANAILIIAGDRGGLFVLDIVLLMRLSLLGVRFKWWQGTIIAVVIVLATPALMVLRQSASRSWTLSGFLDAVTFKSSDAVTLGTDPISATLVEGGLSYKVVMGVVALVPDSRDYHYGVDYAKSLVSAIPYFSKFFHDVVPNNSLWVKDYVDHPLSTSGLGFLQLAEAYVQFGVWGVALFYLAAGFSLVYFWRRFSGPAVECRSVAFFLVLVNAVLLWVRNDFNMMVKPAVWCFVFLIAIPKIIGLSRRPSPAPAPLEVVEPEIVFSPAPPK